MQLIPLLTATCIMIRSRAAQANRLEQRRPSQGAPALAATAGTVSIDAIDMHAYVRAAPRIRHILLSVAFARREEEEEELLAAAGPLLPRMRSRGARAMHALFQADVNL